MADNQDDLPVQRTGFLARLSATETIVVAIIAMIALAGLMLIGKGFYMKAKTELFAAEKRVARNVFG
ncbi:hypothetical protein [Sinorhizobium fredii]|uniref:Uncharacterized protein n=1 Tax=Rhizobium fredii TaxID=380 RepID=A0A2A6LX28_RHIFR|nr:hypothetical protein [Sinorhizobium fredii]ASY69772.1 hypothetical protein SF83666_c23570 [Sinorhizobium fredii CCBAU 83666]AWI57974.1 hypothetical protein AB395_00002322 [Sinorhizobium fredii CCBAU 45436]PDT46945.1 hypothetical protein CO661_14740 [Sinorhizobium fredii]